MTRWIAITHHLPERTRLRSPALRRDEPACDRVADALARLPGVQAVHVRPYTGSALVEHAADVSPEVVAGAAAEVLGGARVLARGEPPPLSEEVPALSSLARKVARAARDLDREIRRHTEGSIDLGTLAALGMVGAGAAEIVRTGELSVPPWYNLAWWGVRTFVTAEEREIRVERDPDADS